MAIARCEECGVPAGTTNVYSTKKYFPVSYPESGLICGSPECRNDAVIWLTSDDEKVYRKGERIFSVDSATTKVKLE